MLEKNKIGTQEKLQQYFCMCVCVNLYCKHLQGIWSVQNKKMNQI